MSITCPIQTPRPATRRLSLPQLSVTVTEDL
jgi:hypothetical protein